MVDLYVLGRPDANLGIAYYPEVNLETYSSIVWEEVYSGYSKFVYRSPEIDQTLRDIRPGYLIGITGSREVMIVEEISFEMTENYSEEIVVSGRSLASIMEQRVLDIPYDKFYRSQKKYSDSQVACLVAQMAVSGSVINANPWMNDGTRNPKNGISKLHIAKSLSTTEDEGPLRYRYLKAGNAGGFFNSYLNMGRLGARVIRPTNPPSINYEVTFARDGTMSFGENGPKKNAFLEIYKGNDRTNTNTKGNNKITFVSSGGDFSTEKYLMTHMNWRNSAVVGSFYQNIDVYDRNYESGLLRRTLFVEGDPIPEGMTMGHPDYPEFLEEQTAKGRGEIWARRRTHFFEGEIDTDSSYVYGQDYFLGDLVSFRAVNVSFPDTVQIASYVRTIDREGDRGYPTFTIV